LIGLLQEKHKPFWLTNKTLKIPEKYGKDLLKEIENTLRELNLLNMFKNIGERV